MSGKPLCLACETREVWCVARVPLCTECVPHDPSDYAASFWDHAETCRVCDVFWTWTSMKRELIDKPGHPWTLAQAESFYQGLRENLANKALL